jgi:hypothetical protein
VKSTVFATALILGMTVTACGTESPPKAAADSIRSVPQPATPTPPPKVTVAPSPAPTTQGRKTLPAGFSRTTLSGIFTTAEAQEGRDMYLGLCQSCHTAASHTGPPFRKKWAGRPLAELFSYMRTNMPKNEPASLDDYSYGVLLAYMLQLNGMPPGKSPLSTDSITLAKIMIDTVRTK